ncbi:hypothetical protein EWM64_g8181 [Hericium alpestre]|uniref:Uncharacterized protein n=1 Tax=Hericium alpestre TaxID=135208 RepID=A0A4Y9ZPA2_9AGAM|nr:hypothetical protein EWM64_g8181 [Hericium alpestre]
MYRAELLALTLACAFLSALAIPTWENYVSRDSIGSLVPGAGFIEALGLKYGTPYYLSSSSPRGVPGNATIEPSDAPPLFYVDHGRLMQFTNESYILHVNLVNTTLSETDPMPYKLVLDHRRSGLQDIHWRWRGTLLHFDHGQKTNLGLFYTCKDRTGAPAVYMYLDPAPTPKYCSITTLHSFSHLGLQNPEQEPLT